MTRWKVGDQVTALVVGDAVERLAAHLDAHPGVAVAGPRLQNPDGSLQRSVRGFPTLWRVATEYFYLRKLAPGGSIEFHISNRYLNLEPVLVEIARDAKLAGIVGADTLVTRAQRAMFKMDSRWVVLSRKPTDHAQLAVQPGWHVLPPTSPIALWTDDFSNVLSVFSWH